MHHVVLGDEPDAVAQRGVLGVQVMAAEHTSPAVGVRPRRPVWPNRHAPDDRAGHRAGTRITGGTDTRALRMPRRQGGARQALQPAGVRLLPARAHRRARVGRLVVDVAYGGMTYVLVEASDVGFELNPDEARSLCEMGQRIKTAAAEQLKVEHPINPDIPGITAAFTGPALPRNRRARATR